VRIKQKIGGLAACFTISAGNALEHLRTRQFMF
jgi:hypothetical protein